MGVLTIVNWSLACSHFPGRSYILAFDLFQENNKYWYINIGVIYI